MKLSSSLLAFSLAFAAPAFAAGDHDTHWGYTGHHGPESWGTLSPKFQACAVGKNQSPINIVSTVEGNLPALQPAYRPAKISVVNNGHTIQADYADESNTLTVDGKTYTLKQFHFHVPSENQIKGQSFPLEAHFVHTDKDGNLAVLGVLYQAGGENDRLRDIWRVMPKKAGPAVPLGKEFDAAKLLPAKLDYYRFNGSLTTPPCSEGVTWMLLKQTDTIGKAQIEAFGKAVGGANNRPVQPVNARVVVE